MPAPRETKSGRGSRKTTTATKKKGKTVTTTTGRTPTNVEQRGKTQTAERERTSPGIQRLDQPAQGLDKMPSNAPTMAIAPSDYEHIFHEGPANVGAGAQSPKSPESGTPQPQPQPQMQQPQQQIQQQQQQQQPRNPYQPTGPAPPALPSANIEVQVTPDGYTLLGQPPLNMSSPTNTRRVAMPPHVVRANNQFSRAALARVARYLASRSEL